MLSHMLNCGSKKQTLRRLGTAVLLAFLAAIYATNTSQAAPRAQVDPCNFPGLATIINPVGGAVQVRMYAGPTATDVQNSVTSIQRIELGGGVVVLGYCISSTQPRPNGVTLCLEGDIGDVRLAYLIAKYPPDTQNRINQAARQAAVWHYSNGAILDLPDATTEDATVDAAVAGLYEALLAEIDAIDPNNPPAIMGPGLLALSVAPATAINQLPAQPNHPITVTVTKGGVPLPGIEVQVASNFGQFNQTTATTDATGQASFTISSDVAGTANITATAVVTTPRSLEYLVQSAPTYYQPFGVPSSATDVLTATASKEWRTTVLQPGRITLTKNVQGTAVGEQWAFTFTLDGGSPRVATDTAQQVTWDALVPDRTYILSEANPGSAWTAGSFVCTLNGAPVGAIGPSGFAVPVTPGADIICSITNTKVTLPSLFAVGNLVWLDVGGLPRDGIQQSVEQTSGGVNGVQVELLDGSGQPLVPPQVQFTGPNSEGQPGYYLFSNLPAGSYQVRFCLPAGYSPTLQNQGSDDTVDSDGNSSGSNATCSYYQTEVFGLPNSLMVGNADLSRDFGLWRPTDYGDNPNDPVQYPTRAVSLTIPANAARHVIIPDLYFGSLVDAEDDGQPTTPANGDDTTGEIDDEDGVTFLTPLQPCTTAQVQLAAFTSNQVAYYGAFFDWNGNGIFDPGEGFNGQIGTTTAPSQTIVISIPVPCTAVQLVYMRFRLALNPAEVQAGTGTALSGEVEDYVLAAVGDRVWFDNNKDGLQGDPVAEPGVPNVVVTLCNAATGQPVLVGGQPLTTTTNIDGIYGFYNVLLTSYCVIFDLNTLPPNYVVTTQNAGSDDTKDSDADATGRTGATGILAPTQIDPTLDMGIYAVPPTNEEPGAEPVGTFRMYLPDVRP